jgi:uncharacterized protein DUF11
MTGARSTHRLGGWTIATSLTLFVVAISLSTGASAAGECVGGQADLLLTQSASQLPSGNAQFTDTASNFGPDCAPNVHLRVELPPGSKFVSFISVAPANWSCPTPAGSQIVDCILPALAAPATTEPVTATVAIEATPTSGTDHATLTSGARDRDLSNNENWAAFATKLSTATAVGKQSASISRPSPGSVSVLQLLPTSLQAAGVPAPCVPNCLADKELVVETDPTDPAQFPAVHLEFALSVVARTSVPIKVYRFDHEAHIWLGPLPPCAGFTGNPDVGCVSSLVISRGRATIAIWTSHNGHIRG